MNCRTRPCAECPWVKATPPGQFSRERFEALRGTTGEPGAEVGIGAGIFACHKSQEGRELPCAGWLASVGYWHIGMRLAAARGEIPGTAFRPEADWPELHESYDEMMEAKAA